MRNKSREGFELHVIPAKKAVAKKRGIPEK